MCVCVCVCVTVCMCISCRDHYSTTGQVCRPQGGFYENEKDVKLTIIILRSDPRIYTCLCGTCESVRVCACLHTIQYMCLYLPITVDITFYEQTSEYECSICGQRT